MVERRNTRRNLLVVVAVAALFVSAAGVVALAQGGEDEVFTGCVNQNSGVLKRVAIGSDPAKPCSEEETEITWDRAGPALGDRIAELEERVAELEEPFGTLDLFVDCDAGDAIGAALADAETHLGRVNITISGVCEESVNVRRDNVSFRGTQRSDGIRAGSTDPFAVGLFGARGVGFSNMTISGGTGGGAFGSITANRSTFDASDITVRDSSVDGIELLAGSSAFMSACTIADNSGRGVDALSGSGIGLNDCEITGNGQVGVFAGGAGSATIFVGNSEIVDNGNGVSVGPGGTITLSDTLVANNHFGVAVEGGRLRMAGDTRIIDNEADVGGVSLGTGSSAVIGFGPVLVEGNSGPGINVAGGSNLWANELIVRNNGSDGISIHDLSTVGVVTAQITDNGGWGINCAGPPAVAVLGGQGLFNPPDIVFSSNTNGATNCG